MSNRRQQAIEFHRKGLALGEAAHPDVTWWDVYNACFLWLISLFQLGDLNTAIAYLERGERVVKTPPEGQDVLHV